MEMTKNTFAIVLLGFLAVSSANANLVTNGSFESPTAAECSNGASICRNNGLDSTWTSGQNMGGWIVGSSSVDLLNSGAGIPADGSQWVDLNGDYGTNGSIYQDLVTTVGKQYLLRFAMSAETVGCDGVFGPNGDKTASVSWGGGAVDNITLSSTVADLCRSESYPLEWTYFEYNLTATGAVTRLMFADNMPWITAHGMGLDDVSVTEVPEPSIIALLVIGLSVLGFARRAQLLTWQ